MADFTGASPWYQGSYAQPARGYDQPPPMATYPQQQPYASTSFDEEPPLLEELGIDVSAIVRKTRCVMTNQLSSEVLKNLDLGGPLLLYAALGCVHLLQGKLHFGIILGWTVVASVGISWVASMIAGPNSKTLDMYTCVCLLGYCMMPMLLFSLVVLIASRGVVLAVMGVVFVSWCARLASRMFGALSQDMKEHYWLLFYPCFLFYGSFALISVY